jgi:hypothetical protein
MEATYPLSAPGVSGEDVRSTGEYMDSLEARGVAFDLVDGEATIAVPPGLLDADGWAELGRRRAEVEHLVRVSLTPWMPPAKVAKAERPVFGQAA